MTLTTERQQFEQWWETAMHNGYPPRFGWEHWRDGDGYRDDDGEFQGLWQAWQASRGFLANREAQPVLYASEETLAYAKEGEKSLVTWSEPMGDAVIPLFTIPKAQTYGVVNLPTEFISDEGVMVRLEQVMAALALAGVKYERRGDTCRAAMLAQPVSGGYKLPEGFKLMPLEMTDEIGEAIAMEARCCGGIALCIYEAALAAEPEGGNG